MTTMTMTVEGQLAADPEVRYLPDGTPVARLRVLHTVRVRQGDTWTDGATTAVTVTAWRGLAERAAESLERGDTVVVTGRDPHAEAYTSRDGEARADLRLTADSLSLSLRFRQAHSSRPVAV